MKLVFIRHADPDYDHNTLTEVGFKEAKVLGQYLKDFKFDSIYSSPYNRAYYTALKIMKYHNGQELVIKEWLHEFDYWIRLPNEQKESLTWDMYPDFYTNIPDFYDNEKYLDLPFFKESNIKAKYLNVCHEFDNILEKNGYTRNDKMYITQKGNEKVLVFVTHFGLMCVLMSHLMNIPYSLLANTMVCLPSGITTFVSEERKEGKVMFRCVEFGNLSHLDKVKMTPSFHGRFCEKFDSFDRH